MQKTTDELLLIRLRKEDNTSFELLYQWYFPAVAGYVTNHSGSSDDAEDIFQEAIIVLLQKVRQPGFALTASLKTYLFAVAKNLWLKRLRDNRLMPVEDIALYQPEGSMHLNEAPETSIKENKVVGWMNRITAHCARVLTAIFYLKQPMESLMQQLGWKNKHTAANQQYKCIQQLKRESARDNVDA